MKMNSESERVDVILYFSFHLWYTTCIVMLCLVFDTAIKQQRNEKACPCSDRTGFFITTKERTTEGNQRTHTDRTGERNICSVALSIADIAS